MKEPDFFCVGLINVGRGAGRFNDLEKAVGAGTSAGRISDEGIGDLIGDCCL
jgi:hypothetical protein